MEREDFIGRIAHLVWCGYQMGAGQDFNEWPVKHQLGFLRNPTMTAAENHEMWMKDRLAHGWKWGPVKNEMTREHPDLIPFDELPEIERRKDEMDLMARRHALFLWDALELVTPKHRAALAAARGGWGGRGVSEYTDFELLYSETGRCRCGAGLAYPLDHERAMELRAWVCSDALKGQARYGEHDKLDFAFWKVREETSINNHGGATTRPAGTVCRTVGEATCPQCGHKWESEPYDACGRGHHWFSGPCPQCNYAVGGEGVVRSNEGEPIKHRFRDVVIDVARGEGSGQG